jgi:hypothetical protein
MPGARTSPRSRPQPRAPSRARRAERRALGRGAPVADPPRPLHEHDADATSTRTPSDIRASTRERTRGPRHRTGRRPRPCLARESPSPPRAPTHATGLHSSRPPQGARLPSDVEQHVDCPQSVQAKLRSRSRESPLPLRDDYTPSTRYRRYTAPVSNDRLSMRRSWRARTPPTVTKETMASTRSAVAISRASSWPMPGDSSSVGPTTPSPSAAFQAPPPRRPAQRHAHREQRYERARARAAGGGAPRGSLLLTGVRAASTRGRVGGCGGERVGRGTGIGWRRSIRHQGRVQSHRYIRTRPRRRARRWRPSVTAPHPRPPPRLHLLPCR